MSDGMGFRQRKVLSVLADAGRPLPFGYLVRVCDDGCPSAYNNVSVSLRLLRQRGLVRQPSRGLWEAA